MHTDDLHSLDAEPLRGRECLGVLDLDPIVGTDVGHQAAAVGEPCEVPE